MHQCSHRYLPRQDFVSGTDNVISDHPLRSTDLTDAQLLAYLDATFPQKMPWRLWTPPPENFSVIVSALRRKISPRDCLRANFCQQVALDSLLSGYQYPIPILCTFAREYRVRDIAATSSNV